MNDSFDQGRLMAFASIKAQERNVPCQKVGNTLIDLVYSDPGMLAGALYEYGIALTTAIRERIDGMDGAFLAAVTKGKNENEQLDAGASRMVTLVQALLADPKGKAAGTIALEFFPAHPATVSEAFEGLKDMQWTVMAGVMLYDTIVGGRVKTHMFATREEAAAETARIEREGKI